MVEVSVDYKGQLRCVAKHGPSGSRIETDAPVDNEGLGQSFSPTDLLATALASCMGTIMGISARRKDIDLEGMRIRVGKEMSADSPRRVSKLEVEITMPIPESHPDSKLLKGAAMGCPVHRSLSPDIEIPVYWLWKS